MKKRIVALVVLLTLILSACGGQNAQTETMEPESSDAAASSQTGSQSEEAPAEEAAIDPVALALELADKAARGEKADFEGGSGKTVGVVMPQFDNDGWRGIYIGALSKAIEMDASVITLDARNNVDTQLAMIQDLITRQVDALVFVPVDSAAMSTAVLQANEAGIPVVTMDRSTEGGEVVALVESNNVEVGKTAANLMLDAADQAGVAVEDLKVLELLGDLATSAGQERHEGFSGEASSLGMNVVAELPTNWDAEKANAAVLDGFQANPDINAIYMASGCAMYAGVESALKSLDKLIPAGQEGHIILISTDGCPAPVEGIRQGYVDADAAHQLVTIGQRGVEIALKAVDGEMPEESIVRTPPDPVLLENVDSLDHWFNKLTQ